MFSSVGQKTHLAGLLIEKNGRQTDRGRGRLHTIELGGLIFFYFYLFFSCDSNSDVIGWKISVRICEIWLEGFSWLCCVMTRGSFPGSSSGFGFESQITKNFHVVFGDVKNRDFKVFKKRNLKSRISTRARHFSWDKTRQIIGNGVILFNNYDVTIFWSQYVFSGRQSGNFWGGVNRMVRRLLNMPKL